MKKTFLLLLILVPALLIAKDKEEDTDKELNIELSIGAGISASTNGFGGNIIARFNEKIALRLGYEYINLKLGDKNFSDNGMDYNVKPRWKSGGFSAIAEYQFATSFYVAGGIVVPLTSSTFDMTPTKSINFGEMVIEPEDIGVITLKAKPQNKVAPYLGIGYNLSFLDDRMSFNAEVGAHYHHRMIITASGTKLLSENGNSEDTALDDVNTQLRKMEWTRFYPTLKIGLTYYFF
ncbi:MAG: hypothetical protein RL662_2307 [Bacteroidota bacterium]|jgi:hypothetical protein